MQHLTDMIAPETCKGSGDHLSLVKLTFSEAHENLHGEQHWLCSQNTMIDVLDIVWLLTIHHVLLYNLNIPDKYFVSLQI